jgi:hypothetical protein
VIEQWFMSRARELADELVRQVLWLDRLRARRRDEQLLYAQILVRETEKQAELLERLVSEARTLTSDEVVKLIDVIADAVRKRANDTQRH